MTLLEKIQSISGIVESLGTVVALIAILLSIGSFRKQMKTESYGKIDEMYFELQRAAMDDPALANPSANLGKQGFAEPYDLYASMIWNFLETIHDRCLERNDDLRQTWQPILEYEGMRHKDWLLSPGNSDRFKRSFIAFLNEGGFADKKSKTPLRGAFQFIQG